MNNNFNNRIPYEIYIIINKCENLPDFREEKEKQKGIQRKWQVIFHDSVEQLATPLVAGVADVSWMCETFLKMKSAKPLSMSIVDEKSRVAGIVVLDMSILPVGDKKLLKPDKNNEGSREAYRNFAEMQKATFTTQEKLTATLSFWVWVLSFKEKSQEKGMLNLQDRLQDILKVPANLIKLPNIGNFERKTEQPPKLNLNPFEIEDDSENKYCVFQTGKPITNPNGKLLKLPNKLGNSSFTDVVTPKFRNSIWMPKNIAVDDKNPFTNFSRRSSLPLLVEVPISNDNTDAQQFKMGLIRQNLSFSVPLDELDNFILLGQYFKTKSNDDVSTISSVYEQFFTLLNDLQRRYASKIVEIKNLTKQKDDLVEEVDDLQNKLWKLKAKLINNNLIDMLTDI